jgi:protein-tyrosine phosphatase
LDDGSKSLEESVAMLRLAGDSGTTDIVATPHADLEYKFQPELIRQRVEEITTATAGFPRIHEGCDFHLTYDNIQDAIAHPAKYTIAHKSYLMVEFSDLLIFRNVSEIFASLREAGIVPVITHPERNQLLQQRLPHLKKWVAEGCYLQVTAQSLLGQFGNTARNFSLALLKKNLVHFLASDAHDTVNRPPVLRDAYQWVEKNHGEPLARRLLVDNPRAAVDGVPLPPFDGEVTMPKRWYQVWR